eukprot:Em0445g2a
MEALIWLALAAAVVIVIQLSSVAATRSTAASDEALEPQGTNVGRGRRRRNLGSRIALAQRRTRGAAREDEEDDDNDEVEARDEDGGEEEDDVSQLIGKVGAKKQRKLQEKAEKKAMREQEDDERRQKEKRSLEGGREAAGGRTKEIEEAQKSENLLQEFIDHIKRTKVVFLEDLASQFNLRTQDAISRVNSLQESGQLTGVVDDRGKFIYISKEELDSVAKFIRQRGRVSIAELVSSSNTLINLQPEPIPVQ